MRFDAKLAAIEGMSVVAEAVPSRNVVRFGKFEVDLRAGEMRKGKLKLKLSVTYTPTGGAPYTQKTSITLKKK